MAYQKCSVCNGTGRVIDTMAMSTGAICRTCNGSCIIDESSGRPPAQKNKSVNDDFNKVIDNDLEK